MLNTNSLPELRKASRKFQFGHLHKKLKRLFTNFKVAENHDSFAGTIGALVHNADYPTPYGASLADEVSALSNLGSKSSVGNNWETLRQAYQTARGQVDFTHIEAELPSMLLAA